MEQPSCGSRAVQDLGMVGLKRKEGGICGLCDELLTAEEFDKHQQAHERKRYYDILDPATWNYYMTVHGQADATGKQIIEADKILREHNAALLIKIDDLDTMVKRWLSVNECLPEMNMDSLMSAPCLVLNKYGWMGRGFYRPKERDWTNETGAVEGVTYWMPLPEMPSQ